MFGIDIVYILVRGEKMQTDLKILLVDDDMLSLTSMGKALKLNGFDVDMFSDPEKAWTAFQLSKYHFVFSDIMMKPIDGIDFLKKVKEISPLTNVFLFTGFFTETKQKEAIMYGAERVYSKPVPIKEIIDNLRLYRSGEAE